MTSAAATTNMSVSNNLAIQIEQLRKEAEDAKKALNYELAFVLIDQADSLEKQLNE